MQEIVSCVEPAAFDAYMEARDRLMEQRMAREFEEQKRELEERLQRQLHDQITPARNKIINTILTLHCPRCKAAWLDFDGCLALTCGCGCGFCAVCLQDCGSDAHAHIGTCKFAGPAQQLFVPAETITRMQNAWRKERLRDFIKPLNPQVAQRVLNSLAQEFRDLGLDVD